MFYARQDSNDSEPDSFAIQVRNVSANAAQTAAQGISTATQAAATGIGKGVGQGVYVTRVWAAPRLESAADYTTTAIAPKVSSALLVTAKRVRPVEESKKSHSALAWSMLATAVLATAGAVAALVRHRYRAATAEGEGKGKEVDTGEAVGGAAAAGTEGTPQAASGPADSAATSSDVGVDGRVSTSGW